MRSKEAIKHQSQISEIHIDAQVDYGVVYVTMKGFNPVEVPQVLGDKSNDWLVERVVATPIVGFGWPWPAKPKPK